MAKVKRIALFLALFLHVAVWSQEVTHSVVVCDNGLEMLAWDLEFIRHARYSIDVSACYLGGEIGRELLTAIEARLEVCPDLRAHILATPVLLEEEDRALIDRLRTRYPNNFHIEYAASVMITSPDLTGIDNHIKLCVVDECYFSMGGTNLNSSGCSEGTYTPSGGGGASLLGYKLPAGMRDQDIVGKGPMAEQLRQTCCKMIALWHHYNQTHDLVRDPDAFSENAYYFPVTQHPFVERFETAEQKVTLSSDQMQFIVGGPHQKSNAITASYTQLIKGAKKEIKIANVYMHPADAIFNALLDAVNRGVKLTVISNGKTDLSPTFTDFFCWANRMSYVPFFYGKTYHYWDYWSVKGKSPKQTHIYEYYVKDILLHKKMMIVDDAIFVLGSYNFGSKSHLADYEDIMVIRSPDVARAATQVYQRDLEHSREVSCAEAIKWYFDPTTSYWGTLQKRFSGIL